MQKALILMMLVTMGAWAQESNKPYEIKNLPEWTAWGYKAAIKIFPDTWYEADIYSLPIRVRNYLYRNNECWYYPDNYHQYIVIIRSFIWDYERIIYYTYLFRG